MPEPAAKNAYVFRCRVSMGTVKRPAGGMTSTRSPTRSVRLM